MNTTSGRNTPVTCRLRVAGRLDTSWADWFDGFTLTSEPDGTTAITGAITDQAQLHGLLAKIRDLGIALVSLDTNHPTGLCQIDARGVSECRCPPVA